MKRNKRLKLLSMIIHMMDGMVVAGGLGIGL
jgi:hypothetical protein